MDEVADAGADAGRDEGATELQWLCRAVLGGIAPEFRQAEVCASFYPYIGLTHTIRRKGRAWVVRLSDHCRHAPRPALEAVVTILACKALGRRVPKRARQAYDAWRKTPGIDDAVSARRAAKGRKRFAEQPGRHHPLEEICREVNRRFFNDQVEIRKIGWGVRRSWGRLGHYDPSHNTVTVSPVLDSPKVPRFVVAFIVYHEMLHAVFEGAADYGFRRHHPPEFRRAEKAHPDYAAAEAFLREYCARRNRR
ncbi:MAG: hypothetical protein LBT74_02900 [Acidobacteriota bacterium]|jgi:hypothetical protein|nr:hypothetical protein [Acidobacteriota bacterium]